MTVESSGLSIGSFTLAEVAPWKSSLIDNSPPLCEMFRKILSFGVNFDNLQN